MSDPGNTTEPLKRTPPAVVAAAALVGALGTYLFFATLENMGQTVPRVTPVSWIALAVVAAVCGILAWFMHNQIHKRQEPVEPGLAVALLVLGKAALLAGVVFAGGYLMIVLLYLPRMGAPIPAERVVNGGLAVLFAAALAVAGWFLERSCVAPDNDDSGDSPNTLQ